VREERGDVPVASTTTILLDLLGVYVCEATLGKELGHRLDGQSGALGDALVVTIVGLVRACHCRHVRGVHIRGSMRMIALMGRRWLA